MLYEEARVYLDHVSKYGSVLGLESIKSLLYELENPQKDLKFIHIAGTNGKGSILAYISCVLQEAGYRVGRYISPTVMEYLERFQIDGEYMGKEDFAEITWEVKQAAERMQEKGRPSPTAFEIETAIAFLYFKKYDCDYVVLEAGFGGLLDATNIVNNTEVCVFASISMDHMGILGNTLEEIAENKAGIIKAGADVVTAPQSVEVLDILKRKAEGMGCRVCIAEPEKAIIHKSGLSGQSFSYRDYGEITIHLAGKYQIENAVAALEAVGALRARGADIGDAAVRRGMEAVHWPGRFEVLAERPLIIVDGAHNADAARRLAENVEEYLPGKKITAILGVFKDKEYDKIVETMAPYLSRVYTVNLPNAERTCDKERLCEEVRKYGIRAETAEGIQDAVEKAQENTEEGDVILIFGSLSYLGKVIRIVGRQADKHPVERKENNGRS